MCHKEIFNVSDTKCPGSAVWLLSKLLIHNNNNTWLFPTIRCWPTLFKPVKSDQIKLLRSQVTVTNDMLTMTIQSSTKGHNCRQHAVVTLQRCNQNSVKSVFLQASHGTFWYNRTFLQRWRFQKTIWTKMRHSPSEKFSTLTNSDSLARWRLSCGYYWVKHVMVSISVFFLLSAVLQRLYIWHRCH